MMHEALRNLNLYLMLKSRIDQKIALSKNAVDLLPPADFDFQTYFDLIIPEDIKPPEEKGRGNYINQWNSLLHKSRGKPTIIAFNMLLISYLRRDTPFTARAWDLFQRLWKERVFDMLEILSTRDLISTLRTFADHAQNAQQRLIAKLGFNYAHMIKIYESERKAEGHDLQRANYKVPGGCPKIGMENLWGIVLGGDNSFEIVNVLLAEEIERDEIIGPMILTLLGRVQSGHTVFSRFERARLDANFKTNTNRDWAFGFNPETVDLNEPPF